MKIHRIAAAWALIASPMVLCAQQSAIGADSEMRASIELYTTDRASLTRAYTIDLSAGRRDRMTKFYREWLDRLAKLNLDSMSQEGRIDYILFRNHLEHELRQQELQMKVEGATAPLTPFAQTIVGL